MGFFSRNAQKKAELQEICRHEGHQWVTLSEPPLKLMGDPAPRIPPQVTRYCARCGESI
jgi:hypothetical protein